MLPGTRHLGHQARQSCPLPPSPCPMKGRAELERGKEVFPNSGWKEVASAQSSPTPEGGLGPTWPAAAPLGAATQLCACTKLPRGLRQRETLPRAAPWVWTRPLRRGQGRF